MNFSGGTTRRKKTPPKKQFPNLAATAHNAMIGILNFKSICSKLFTVIEKKALQHLNFTRTTHEVYVFTETKPKKYFRSIMYQHCSGGPEIFRTEKRVFFRDKTRKIEGRP